MNPRRKDILVEHDWQEENVEPGLCNFHTHKPDATTIQQLQNAFAAMPVTNPDGSTGINLIQDVGQGGVFTGGNFIDVANGTVIGTTGADFQTYKAANFAPERIGYFHYALNVHRYTSNPQSSGVAEILGDDLLVTLGCSWNQGNSNTIMHELGHNLALQHGGDSPCNWKPNYNSIMNYRFQFKGIDTDCSLEGNGVMDYSIGARVPLHETHLNENLGLCGGKPQDWNGTNGLESDVATDINFYLFSLDPTGEQAADCGGLQTTLTDFNDFNALNLKGLPGAPGGGAHVPAIEATCGPRPQQ